MRYPIDWRVEPRRLEQDSELAGSAVFQYEIDKKAKTLKRWVRRKRGNQVSICSGCEARIAETG